MRTGGPQLLVKVGAGAVVVVYLVVAAGVFVVHTQMPVTLGLAVVRSILWPISLVRHQFTPRGVPQRMD